jgi:hypothetical protein|tara:strand:- start:273 stop:887 length:615 start_codon:yes stop_codon:yes gene_type:complete
MSDGIKLGQLLCDADIITKRQLSKALAEQVKGKEGTVGEILVDMGFCSFDDITDALMNSSTNTKQHEEKQVEIHPEPVIEESKEEPIEISEDKVLDTKFTLSVQTMIAAGTGLASLIGMWYALQAEIEEAKELPAIDIEKIFSDEYPSKPEGHNWPRSYEQYKTQVGQLQEDMDEVFDQLDEYEETIEELEKQVTNLRVKVGNK